MDVGFILVLDFFTSFIVLLPSLSIYEKQDKIKTKLEYHNNDYKKRDS